MTQSGAWDLTLGAQRHHAGTGVSLHLKNKPSKVGDVVLHWKAQGAGCRVNDFNTNCVLVCCSILISGADLPPLKYIE